MSQTGPQPLAGMRIWLTRPAHQAQDWAQGLQAAGATVAVEPLLDIVPPQDEAAARAALVQAEQADIVVATSVNAVRGAWRLRPDFAPRGMLCAVGRGSAQALEVAAGRPVQAPQQGDTSEALLGIAALSAVAGRHVVLLSGEGGRKKLVSTLSARGARVDKAMLYRRRPAAIATPRLVALMNSNDALVVTSGEALQHLCALLARCDRQQLQDALARMQVVVPSPRVVQLMPDDLFQCPPRAVTRMTVDAVVDALAPMWRCARQ